MPLHSGHPNASARGVRSGESENRVAEVGSESADARSSDPGASAIGPGVELSTTVPTVAEQAQPMVNGPGGAIDAVRSGPSAIHGTGCFARTRLAENERIGTFTGRSVEVDGPHVLWASRDGRRWEGREGTSVLRFLNHSDRPNAAFDGFDLYALADIAADAEITIDYQPD